MTSVDLTRSDMKILRLYPGTILALDKPAFEVGTALDPRYAPSSLPGVALPLGEGGKAGKWGRQAYPG